MQRSWTRVIYSNPVCLFEIEIVALLFSGCWIFFFLSGCNMPTLPPTSVAKLNMIPKLCESVVMCRIVVCKLWGGHLGSCTSESALNSCGFCSQRCKAWLWATLQDMMLLIYFLVNKKKWVDCFSLGLFFFPPSPLDWPSNIRQGTGSLTPLQKPVWSTNTGLHLMCSFKFCSLLHEEMYLNRTPTRLRIFTS